MQNVRSIAVLAATLLVAVGAAGALVARAEGEFQAAELAPAAGQAPAISLAQAGPRTIYMAALEPRGTANPDEAMPTDPLPPGGGYIVRPTADGLWEAVSYRWEPGTIIARQGEEITLEIFGINGRRHDVTVEAFGQSATVERGRLARVTFTPDRTGMFTVVCTIHQPTMTADLVVLPAI